MTGGGCSGTSSLTLALAAHRSPNRARGRSAGRHTISGGRHRRPGFPVAVRDSGGRRQPCSARGHHLDRWGSDGAAHPADGGCHVASRCRACRDWSATSRRVQQALAGTQADVGPTPTDAPVLAARCAIGAQPRCIHGRGWMVADRDTEDDHGSRHAEGRAVLAALRVWSRAHINGAPSPPGTCAAQRSPPWSLSGGFASFVMVVYTAF